MTPETALQLTIVAIAVAAIGLIASEIRENLLRERARDQQRAEQENATTSAQPEPFADVLEQKPPPRRARKR